MCPQLSATGSPFPSSVFPFPLHPRQPLFTLPLILVLPFSPYPMQALSPFLSSVFPLFPYPTRIHPSISLAFPSPPFILCNPYFWPHKDAQREENAKDTVNRERHFFLLNLKPRKNTTFFSSRVPRCVTVPAARSFGGLRRILTPKITPKAVLYLLLTPQAGARLECQGRWARQGSENMPRKQLS